MSARTGAPRRRPRIGLALVVVACTLFYLLPLVAMARFAFQRIPVASLTWSDAFDRWTIDGLSTAFRDEQFRSALWVSVRIALWTVVLNTLVLLPTALWTHLRVPRLRSLVEGITLLPWVVPPIALVVGVATTFRAAFPSFLGSDLSLVPFYAVLAMPFTYRALDAGLRAIDLRTLTEASRNLGAGWWTTLARVVAPNLSSALLGSAFLTATVVLGEFTIAALLLKETLPTFMADYQRREPQGGMALALASMFVTSAVLFVMTLVLRRRGGGLQTGRMM